MIAAGARAHVPRASQHEPSPQWPKAAQDPSWHDDPGARDKFVKELRGMSQPTFDTHPDDAVLQ
eukprot:4888756-Pyramimonas_sp.AAC.1